MTQKPAPDELLDIIRCKYHTSCSKKCGCRRAGLECSPACTNCYNNNCTNCPLPIHEEVIENECNENDDDETVDAE